MGKDGPPSPLYVEWSFNRRHELDVMMNSEGLGEVLKQFELWLLNKKILNEEWIARLSSEQDLSYKSTWGVGTGKWVRPEKQEEKG